MAKERADCANVCETMVMNREIIQLILCFVLTNRSASTGTDKIDKSTHSGLVVWHEDNTFVSHCQAHVRQTNACVSSRAFNDSASRPYQPYNGMVGDSVCIVRFFSDGKATAECEETITGFI